MSRVDRCESEQLTEEEIFTSLDLENVCDVAAEKTASAGHRLKRCKAIKIKSAKAECANAGLPPLPRRRCTSLYVYDDKFKPPDPQQNNLAPCGASSPPRLPRTSSMLDLKEGSLSSQESVVYEEEQVANQSPLKQSVEELNCGDNMTDDKVTLFKDSGSLSLPNVAAAEPFEHSESVKSLVEEEKMDVRRKGLITQRGPHGRRSLQNLSALGSSCGSLIGSSEKSAKEKRKTFFSYESRTLGYRTKKKSKPPKALVLAFDSINNDLDAETVLAQKGLTLSEAITKPLERRGLSLDQVHVFIQSSKTALPLQSDCSLLAGSVLKVRAREDEKQTSSSFSSLTSRTMSSESLTIGTSVLKDKKNVKTGKKNSSEDAGYGGSVAGGGGVTGSGSGGVGGGGMSGGSGGCGDTSPYSTLTRRDVRATPPAKPTSKLQSLFSSTFKAQDKQDQLNELLNSYSFKGLPKMPDLLTLGRPHYEPGIFHLERHWTEIVANHESLNKRQRDQQEAIWELLTTEVEYIRKLRVIIDLFMCCLFNLQNEQLLNEIEADKLFSNICDVYYATCHFWNSHMSQVIRHARERHEPLNPCLLKAGFLVFEKIFEPYTKYCLEQDICREYIKTKTKEVELFRIFIMWAETQSQCNRLKLIDLIVKPWQHLTKYKLLLYAIRKPLDKTDDTSPSVDEQKSDITLMIDQVEKFMSQVNIAMRQRHECKQLSQMIDRIESYDAIEAPNDESVKLINEFCKLDLNCPVPGCSQQEMRILLLEGSLKLKDTYTKMDVYCFLFTDMLLITKPAAKRGDKVKVIKPPMRLDKIVLHSLRDITSFMLLYLNEYHMAQAVYTFHGDSKLWLENVTKAQIEYKEKRNQYLTRNDALIMDPYDDIDDDFPLFLDAASSVTAGSDIARTDSSGSADTFLPNYGLQGTAGSDVDDDIKSTTTESRARSANDVREVKFHQTSMKTQLSAPSDLSIVSAREAGKQTNFLSVPKMKLFRAEVVAAVSAVGENEHRSRSVEVRRDAEGTYDFSEPRGQATRSDCGTGAQTGGRRVPSSDQDVGSKTEMSDSMRSSRRSISLNSTASLHLVSPETEVLELEKCTKNCGSHITRETVLDKNNPNTHQVSEHYRNAANVQTQTPINFYSSAYYIIGADKDVIMRDGCYLSTIRVPSKSRVQSKSLPDFMDVLVVNDGAGIQQFVMCSPEDYGTCGAVVERQRFRTSVLEHRISKELQLSSVTLEASKV